MTVHDLKFLAQERRTALALRTGVFGIKKDPETKADRRFPTRNRAFAVARRLENPSLVPLGRDSQRMLSRSLVARLAALVAKAAVSPNQHETSGMSQASDQPPELLTIAEVADALRVSEETVRNWIKRNRLKAIRVVGQYRIRREDLGSLISRGDVGDICTMSFGGRPRT